MSNDEGQVYSRLKRLRNASDTREYMQALIDAVDKNEISIEKGRALGYLIKILLDTISASDFEERLEHLESVLGDDAA